jgi:hypothetical protein
MKKSKNIVLIVTPVLSAALLNACGGSQPRTFVNTSPAASPAATPLPVSTVAPQTAQTRDVYSNLNDCIKDWGEKELCEQMGDDDDRDYRSRYRTGGTGRYFYGPGYSSSNRIITYKGKTLTPTGKVSKLPSFVSAVPSTKTTGSSTVPTSKTTTGTTSSSTTSSSTVPSTTGKSTTSSTSPSSSTSSTSSTSSYSPYSSSSTTRGGFGTTSSYSSSSSSSSSGS